MEWTVPVPRFDYRHIPVGGISFTGTPIVESDQSESSVRHVLLRNDIGQGKIRVPVCYRGRTLDARRARTIGELWIRVVTLVSTRDDVRALGLSTWWPPCAPPRSSVALKHALIQSVRIPHASRAYADLDVSLGTEGSI